MARSAVGVTALTTGIPGKELKSTPVVSHRVYACLLDPRENPDYARHPVQAPSWDAFGHRTHFGGGGFQVKDDLVVDYVQEIEKWKDTFEISDAFQANYPILFAKNLPEVVEEMKRRDVYLYDVVGYCAGCGGPGNGLAGMVQFTLPTAPLDFLEAKLGDHWLGMSLSEQDGAYIGLYAPQMFPSPANRFEQYLNFHRHFQQMHDDHGNRKMMATITLTFGHYLLKEGLFAMIGAETAQGLPNDQLYYSFLRGAGKQYGVPWWALTSVFNRLGYKHYGPESTEGYLHGPTKGASLSLLKRLRYCLILYNCVLVAYEHGYFSDAPPGVDKLSPIGAIQQASYRWVKQLGQVEQIGTMLTPIAVMLDFFAGWVFPRQLYTGNTYRVWDNLPYQAGDYFTHGVFNLLYPTYQECSYYKDETGFISPTPYGDGVDCLLSDAESWLLERYPLLVIGGELTGGFEIRDKLRNYVEGGGRLVITAGNLAKLPEGLGGIQVAGSPLPFAAKSTVRTSGNTIVEDYPFELYAMTFPAGATVLARCGNTPAAVEVPYGKGALTVLASPFAVCTEAAVKELVVSKMDEPFANPYPLLKHVRHILDGIFRSQMLFDVGDGLSLITCRKGPGEYTLGICNNALREQPLQIISRCGPIEAITEMPLDQAEKKEVGYLPEGSEQADLGTSGKDTIAGGDTRIFAVHVREENVQEIPRRAPPPRPHGRILPLRGRRPIQEEVLARPTFFEHFDGVVADWKYLRDREAKVLKKEAGWIGLQKIRLFFDLTSGINLYPDLRLVENDDAQYAASMDAIEDVLNKMELVGARDLILSLHQLPLFFSPEKTWASFQKTLRRLSERAAGLHIDLHLRPYRGKLARTHAWQYLDDQGDHNDALQFLDRVGAANLRLAASTAFLLAEKAKSKQSLNLPKEKVGLWLVSAPRFDVAGRLWDWNGRLASYDLKGDLADLLAIAPGAPMVLDAVYESLDEEYLDATALKGLMKEQPA